MLENLIYSARHVNHFFKTFLLGALPANIQYGFPSKKLTVIGITGTDGKTTSSSMVYHVLQTAGKKVALISTVAAFIGSEEIDTGFHVTTPEPRQLQKLLKKIVDKGYEYVVLEMTSHGIYQYRTWGVNPNIAGLTNVTYGEALDYHGNYENYVDAKVQMLNSSGEAWINTEDEAYEMVSKKIDKKVAHEYAALKNIPANVKAAIQDRFKEGYNHANATMVYHISKSLGVDDDTFVKAVKSFVSIRGRMQEVPNSLKRSILVDFAHTPNGIKQALTGLKTRFPGKRIIAVYGCAGLRDPRKRPAMTKNAVELADYVVLTAEDPRVENIWTIIRQMKEQLTSGHNKLISIPDREQAIRYSIFELSKPGDVIAVFGKGHEQSMAYGTTEYLWNDIEAITEMVKKS